MLFNTFSFAYFAAAVLAVYYVLGRRGQNLWLLIASYVFYGWWDWRFCFLLAFSTALDYSCARGMAATSKPTRRQIFLLLSLAGNLGMLGFFKYFDFFIKSTADLLNSLGLEANLPLLQVVLPVGISFFTFQTMAYTIDVYRGRIEAQKNLTTVALYVAYFPQLVAGPIERAQHMFGQFEKTRRITGEQIAGGAFLILTGLFKKIVIADAAAPAVQQAFIDPANADWPTLASGICLFTLQIYGDFSGYTDIARGVSRLLGIELMRNFEQPYSARSVTEFWRRWHISLSTWLRDYLYIPLGGNRRGVRRTYINLMLTMLLGGLWHGASWNFVIWGGLHGFFLAFHKAWLDRRGEDWVVPGGQIGAFIYGLGAWFLTLLLVMLCWVFFRASTFDIASTYLTGLAHIPLSPALWIEAASPIAFFTLLVLLVDAPQRITGQHTFALRWPWAIRGVYYVLLILLICLYQSDTDAPFIYFQF